MMCSPTNYFFIALTAVTIAWSGTLPAAGRRMCTGTTLLIAAAASGQLSARCDAPAKPLAPRVMRTPAPMVLKRHEAPLCMAFSVSEKTSIRRAPMMAQSVIAMAPEIRELWGFTREDIDLLMAGVVAGDRICESALLTLAVTPKYAELFTADDVKVLAKSIRCNIFRRSDFQPYIDIEGGPAMEILFHLAHKALFSTILGFSGDVLDRLETCANCDFPKPHDRIGIGHQDLCERTVAQVYRRVHAEK